MKHYHVLRALLEEKAPVGLFSLIESEIHQKQKYTIASLNAVLMRFMSTPQHLPVTPSEWETALREWVIRDISNVYLEEIISDD